MVPASTLFGRVALQQHSVSFHYGTRGLRPLVWVAPGAFYALANSFAFADFCGAARRNARGIGAIADFLSLVFARRRWG
jgi:hypothetical protein